MLQCNITATDLMADFMLRSTTIGHANCRSNTGFAAEVSNNRVFLMSRIGFLPRHSGTPAVPRLPFFSKFMR